MSVKGVRSTSEKRKHDVSIFIYLISFKNVSEEGFVHCFLAFLYTIRSAVRYEYEAQYSRVPSFYGPSKISDIFLFRSKNNIYEIF